MKTLIIMVMLAVTIFTLEMNHFQLTSPFDLSLFQHGNMYMLDLGALVTGAVLYSVDKRITTQWKIFLIFFYTVLLIFVNTTVYHTVIPGVSLFFLDGILITSLVQGYFLHFIYVNLPCSERVS